MVYSNPGSDNWYVDIVMCIDATAAMTPFLDEVKSNALSFYQRFFDGMEEQACGNIEQLRIKVIAFRDYGFDDEPMVESEFFVLPDQNDEFKSFVQNIDALGGGDEPENALEAIALANKSNENFSLIVNNKNHKIKMSIYVKQIKSLNMGNYELKDAIDTYYDIFEYMNDFRCAINLITAIDDLNISWINDLDSDIDITDAMSQVANNKQKEISELSEIITTFDKFAFIEWIKKRNIK